MTGENMKSDLKCSHECKIEGRQSIHARKMSKTSPTRNGAVGTNVHIAADSGLPLTLSTVGDGVKYAKSQDCKRKMDNNDGKTGIATAVDGRLCMNEVMKAIDETPETKHLKDLLLLHLDWSQQQQELILAKDRQLRDLRSERDALKCRLERMERRMSLLRQKGSDLPSPLPAASRDSPRGSVSVPSSAGRDNYGRGHKRKSSLEPQNLSKRFASAGSRRDRSGSVEKERTPRSSSATTVPLTSRRTRLTSEKSDSVCSTASSSHNRSRSRENTETECTSDDGAQNTPKTRNFFRKKWQTDNLSASETLAQRQRVKQIVFKRTKHGREDELLRTTCMYYVAMPEPEKVQPICISPIKPQTEQLKVPSWRIHQVPTGYQLEGTENLDDEIFLKRHQKPEQEEKRRKRWDMQRLREQHLYEKLQGRAPDTSSRSENDQGPYQSFQPDADDAKFIEVTENIPVTAFGYPIPSFKATEFSLPWYEVEKRHERKPGRPKKHHR